MKGEEGGESGPRSGEGDRDGGVNKRIRGKIPEERGKGKSTPILREEEMRNGASGKEQWETEGCMVRVVGPSEEEEKTPMTRSYCYYYYYRCRFLDVVE